MHKSDNGARDKSNAMRTRMMKSNQMLQQSILPPPNLDNQSPEGSPLSTSRKSKRTHSRRRSKPLPADTARTMMSDIPDEKVAE
jgi:hypothetical protein